MNPAELMAALLQGELRERPSGPVAWCKMCHRYHERRKHPATFRRVERTIPERFNPDGTKKRGSGKRMHWAHVAVPEKPKRKTRARRK